jgi:LPS-assembly protein
MADGEEAYITADKGETKQGEYSVLEGNVELIMSGKRIEADHVVYDQKNAEVTATGNVHYRENIVDIKGEHAKVFIDKEQATIQEAEYQLLDRHARGNASLVELVSSDQIRLSNASYTTCPPGDDAWLLKTKRLSLYQAINEGRASHIILEAGGIPVFYFPYMTFPLGKRKSGILVPSYGSSETTGTDISLPFYWNIAPHRDATLTARNMTSRGLQLQSEFRYLNPHNKGQLNLEYLHDDKVFNNHREMYVYKHTGTMSEYLWTEIDFNKVSDADYFRDLGTDLSTTSTSYLEQRVDMNYSGDLYALKFRAQDFQQLDATADPYRRLPQINLSLLPQNTAWGLRYEFTGEFTQFKRKRGLNGKRLDVQPAMSYPMNGDSAYLVPKVAYRYTQYDLENSLSSDDQPDRGLSVTSIDSGIYLEREYTLGEQTYTHTLEPRLYYLYVPFREQSNLIIDDVGNDAVFDSTVPEFGYDFLFSENRFVGADRVGDANQVTLALTSRLLDWPNGMERLSATLGRIYYLRDPRVSMPGTTDPSASSEVVALLGGDLNKHWRVQSSALWDNGIKRLNKGRASLVYSGDARQAMRLSYNYRRDELKQSDLALKWPLHGNWGFKGRWLYSLPENKTLEGLGAVEYNSCCWTFRLAARRYITDSLGTADTALAVQIELKELTNVGSLISGTTDQELFGF